MKPSVLGVLEAMQGLDAGRLSLPLSIAGRLSGISDQQLTLADAEVERSFRLEALVQTPLELGDLVQVELGQRSGELVISAVERRASGQLGSGEHQRRLGRRLRARSAALRTVRGYFEAQEFLEVNTPVRVRAPGLDLHVDALPAGDHWLITSPEHHMKRLLVAGAQRIFQIAHASRAEELGAYHEPEFLLLEWYRAYAGMAQVMDDTEALVCAVAQAVHRELASSSRAPRHPGSAADERHAEPSVELSVGERLINLTRPFPRISVRDAFERYAGVADVVTLARDNEDTYFDLLVGRVEPALAALDRPIFLHGYPLSQASLAQPDPADPETAERFELYLAGVELCNGFGELNDAAEQRRRYLEAQAERQRRGMPVYPLDEDFLAALKEGMPPAGGNALGLDRLLMLAMGEASLAGVVLFPCSADTPPSG